MEEYAQANAVIAPPKAWGKAVPFGWNSWGALQFNLTYPKALEVNGKRTFGYDEPIIYKRV